MTQAIKKFAVIRTDQQEVAVILTSWLEDDKKVFWRPEKDIEYKDALLNELEVGDDWEHLRCDKILKYCDTYVDAIAFSKLGKIDELSDAADSDKVKSSRSDRNKKSNLGKNNGKTSKSVINAKESKKQGNPVVTIGDKSTNVDISSDSEDDDDEIGGKRGNNDDDSFAPAPKKFKTLLSGTDSPSTSTGKNVELSPPENVEPSDPEIEPITDNDNLVLDDILRKFTVDGEVKTERMMGALFVALKQTNKQMTQIGLKVGALETKVKSSLAMQPTHSFSPSTMTMSQHFPIKNLDDMNKIEQKLEMDGTFTTDVVNFMQSKGGETYHELIHAIMAAVMSDEVAKQYSFKGQGGSNIRFNETYLMTCVVVATRSKFPSLSDTAFKSSCSTWLNAASTRLSRGGSNKKKKNVQLKLLPGFDM
ncbi:hypothetical protein TKK_0004396 [Trichogramma kaykai]